MPKFKLEYIWLDGYTPTPNLRGKTQIKEFAEFPTLEQLPMWGFDGSSTKQAEGGVDVRLTAPDGYQAQRSYSIASPPDGDGTIELLIEGLPDGEVSGFFDAVAAVGDTIELRGPIGGSFVWRPEDGGPLLLAGGGSRDPAMGSAVPPVEVPGAISRRGTGQLGVGHGRAGAGERPCLS